MSFNVRNTGAIRREPSFKKQKCHGIHGNMLLNFQWIPWPFIFLTRHNMFPKKLLRISFSMPGRTATPLFGINAVGPSFVRKRGAAFSGNDLNGGAYPTPCRCRSARSSAFACANMITVHNSRHSKRTVQQFSVRKRTASAGHESKRT